MSVRRRSSQSSLDRRKNASHSHRSSRRTSYENEDYLTEVRKLGLCYVKPELRSPSTDSKSQKSRLGIDVSRTNSEDSVVHLNSVEQQLQYVKTLDKPTDDQEPIQTPDVCKGKRPSEGIPSHKEGIVKEKDDEKRPRHSSTKPRPSEGENKLRKSSEFKAQTFTDIISKVGETPQRETSQTHRKSSQPRPKTSLGPPKVGEPPPIDTDMVVKPRKSKQTTREDKIFPTEASKEDKMLAKLEPKSPLEEKKIKEKEILPKESPKVPTLQQIPSTKSESKVTSSEQKPIHHVIADKKRTPDMSKKSSELDTPSKHKHFIPLHKIMSQWSTAAAATSDGDDDAKQSIRIFQCTLTLTIFYDLILIFTFIQLCVVVYLANQYDINLRLRSPLADLPRYAATRIPWIPGQYKLANQISGVWWSLCTVYIPVTIIFCKYYLDHNANIPTEEKTDWIINPHFYRLKTGSEKLTHKKKKSNRQMLLATCLVISTILWLFYFITFCSSFYLFHLAYWREVIRNWLYELQRFYFWHFKDLTEWVVEQSSTAGYHSLDDGRDAYLIIDIIQNIFECCGIYGPEDWSSYHVERPKYHTYRKFMRIGSHFQEAFYLVPNLTTRSVPFSCCKRNKYSLEDAGSVPCNNVNPVSRDVFHGRGCAGPIFNFLTSRWMKSQAMGILFVLLTMIPQIFAMMISIKSTNLNEEANVILNSMKAAMDRRKQAILGLGKAGVSQLKRLTVVYTLPAKFNFKDDDDEGYFQEDEEEQAEEEENNYRREEMKKLQFSKSKSKPPPPRPTDDIDTLYRQIDALEADLRQRQADNRESSERKSSSSPKHQLKQSRESVEPQQEQQQREQQQQRNQEYQRRQTRQEKTPEQQQPRREQQRQEQQEKRQRQQLQERQQRQLQQERQRLQKQRQQQQQEERQRQQLQERQQQLQQQRREQQQQQQQPTHTQTTSGKMHSYRTISASELDKVGIEIRPNTKKLVKRINRIVGRPPWRYSYVVKRKKDEANGIQYFVT